MDFKKFSLLIIIRTTLAIVTLLLISATFSAEGYHAVSLLLCITVIAQFYEIIRFVAKTNAELVRFLDAARYADFSQRFNFKNVGSGFDELGTAFADILEKLQTVRSQQEEEVKRLKAIIEHVPTPLISIQNNGKVTQLNNSARRLFGTNPLTQIQDFQQFSTEFASSIPHLKAGEKQLHNIEIDGMRHRLSVSATELMLGGNKELLLSMQDIQSELDTAQLQAWQDLVRVLTHEIMNSITPVASLAQTAADLVDDIKEKSESVPNLKQEIGEDLEDVTNAVNTVARRSEGLMQFVTSYRRLTRLPEPNKKQTAIATLFEQAKLLTSKLPGAEQITIETSVIPTSLSVDADRDMVEQVLVNLLQNAVHALFETTSEEKPNGIISLSAQLNKRGRVVIEVADNGSGISEELATKVFVPFYTTKRDGSGVGLALTRQVMIAHSGDVTVRKNKQGGATFSLMF